MWQLEQGPASCYIKRVTRINDSGGDETRKTEVVRERSEQNVRALRGSASARLRDFMNLATWGTSSRSSFLFHIVLASVNLSDRIR